MRNDAFFRDCKCKVDDVLACFAGIGSSLNSCSFKLLRVNRSDRVGSVAAMAGKSKETRCFSFGDCENEEGMDNPWVFVTDGMYC